MGTWPGGWLEGRAGTWLGVLRSISSPAHSCVSAKQEDVLLEMWVCRNEWFNKETLWAVIRRGFLSVDKPLLMGEELIVATSELVQAAKAAHHLSRGVREVLTNIMTQSEQFWGYNQPVTLTPEGWQCPGHNLILLLSCSIWGRMELVPCPEALPQILPLPRAAGLKKNQKIFQISASLLGTPVRLCRGVQRCWTLQDELKALRINLWDFQQPFPCSSFQL